MTVQETMDTMDSKYKQQDSNSKHANENNNENKTALEALKQFCATTSIRGLPRVVKSPSLCGKFFWMLGFTAASCMLAWRIATLADLFWERKTMVLTRFEVDNEIIKVFPDITICNIHINSPENSAILEKKENEFESRRSELDKSIRSKRGTTLKKNNSKITKNVTKITKNNPMNDTTRDNNEEFEDDYDLAGDDNKQVDKDDDLEQVDYDRMYDDDDHNRKDNNEEFEDDYDLPGDDNEQADKDDDLEQDDHDRVYDDDDHYRKDDALNDFDMHADKLATFFSFLTSEERLNISSTMEDLIIDCNKLHWFAKKNSYLDKKCDKRMFTRYMDIENMNCYTIKLQNIPNLTLETKGASLIVNLNEYYDDVYVGDDIPISKPSERGARVYIHEHNTMAYAQSYINIAPGNLVDIEIAVSNYSYLGEPYNRCSKASAVEYRTLNGSEFAYTEASCIAACIQRKVLGKCDCILQEFPLLDDEPVCMSLHNNLSTYLTQLSCVDKFWNSSTAHYGECDHRCGPKCKGYLYKTTVSQARWPNEDQHLSFYNRYIKGRSFQDHYEEYAKLAKEHAELSERYDDSDPEYEIGVDKTINKLRKMTLLRDNLIRLDISTTQEIIIYDEIALVSNSEFFNTIASMFIFWIGCTFFSCLEIIEAVALWIKGRVISANKLPITQVIPLDNKKAAIT